MAVDDLIEDNLDDEDILLDEPNNKQQILSDNDEEATEVLKKNTKQPVTKVQIRETKQQQQANLFMQQEGGSNNNNNALFNQPDGNKKQSATTQIVISRNLIKPAESAPTAGSSIQKKVASQVVETQESSAGAAGGPGFVKIDINNFIINSNDIPGAVKNAVAQQTSHVV